MDTKINNDILIIRLDQNESVNEKIIEACKKHKIKTAVVLSGIGQLKNVELGYFKKKGDYSPEIFHNPLELLSLSGNIVKNNENYILHLHSILGDDKKNAIGGHFISGQISVTAEIFIKKIGISIIRKKDKKTGLNSLFIN